MENVLGGTALFTIWKNQLDSEFDLFNSLFLKPRPDQQADAVPCPWTWSCGCFHKVVPDPNGTLLGVCQCDPKKCNTYTVQPYERIPLELDWSKLAPSLARAFAFQPNPLKLGLYNTRQLGTWSHDALSVILTLSTNQSEFLHAITALHSRLGQPFILLAPTSRHCSPAAKELLAGIGSLFFALQDHLCLAPSGGALVSATPPQKLFAEITPLRPDPSDEELARRTFIALQKEDPATRRKRPTLYTVFQLYCVKDLSIPQIARKCRCSIGTVANRLKLLRAKTGAAPNLLRRISPHFIRYEDHLRQAELNHRRAHGFYS